MKIKLSVLVEVLILGDGRRDVKVGGSVVLNEWEIVRV